MNVNIVSKVSKYIIICTLVAANMYIYGANHISVSAAKVSLSDKEIYVGGISHISLDGDGYVLSSSDTSVAYVNEKGVITGKSEGKASIKAKRNGEKARKFSIKVKKKKNKPANIPVCIDEAGLTPLGIETDSSGKKVFRASISNTAGKGTIHRIEYYYTINSSAVGQTAKTVCLKAEEIPAGGSSGIVECEGDISGNAGNMIPTVIKLHTGSAQYTYDVQADKYTLDWGDYDDTPPVISGWIGDKSYNGNDVYRVCYSDRRDNYTFKEHVKAVDDKDGKVKVNVDTDKINWEKDGVYKIKYTASDKAGNTSKAWAKVQVYVKGKPEELADEALGKIIKKKWSDTKKAQAIHKYVQAHLSYSHSGNSRAHWRTVGTDAFISQAGDCYYYYSMSRLLLTRAGIPNIMVRRNPAPPGLNHWWNLVYVNNGWYHFDTVKHKTCKRCLITDAQLKSCSDLSWTDKYPERSKEIISKNP